MNTGTKIYRNYFGIKFGWQAACKFGVAYPVFRKLMYPGDVFKINADLLIRYQPMLSPPMNSAIATVRFAFVPLRLIEENTELIITGSKDGHLSEETLPIFASVFDNLTITNEAPYNDINKNSLLDLLYNIPTTSNGSLTDAIKAKLAADAASPAAYFAKAFVRFWWDYYRDENLFTAYTDFETYWNVVSSYLHVDLSSISNYFPISLKKDRITSSLPWQLKAVAAPTIDISASGTFTPNYNQNWADFGTEGAISTNPVYMNTGSIHDGPFSQVGGSTGEKAAFNAKMNAMLNTSQTGLSLTAATLDAANFRAMMAQTRIFERLARCGSRYTEYLKANFNVAPADGTLQRAQYLGGFKTHIVTTEVVQTAAAGDNPVGTLRGHGITHGTATIKPFMAREIGVVIGILDVKPETIYAQGVDRELTCRSRFDFLNPSFQHLSEQEVRNGEVFFGIDTDSDGNLNNGKTWGFQPYAQELRTGVKHVCGEMRDSLSYWNQALIMSSRPSLNQAFTDARNHIASYNRPFAVSGTDALPMIVDFGGIIEAYRPLVKDGTPGLMDHN